MLQRIVSIATAVLLALTTSAQVSFSANATSGCSPFGVIIQVTAPDASSISSYAWSITRPDGTVHTASSAQYVAVLSQSGNYTVSLTVNGNQTQTVSNFIQVFANPTASFVVDDAIGCFPHVVNFTSTSLPGSGAITSYNWDFGDGSTSNGSTASHTYPQAATYTPVLSIQDENGCIASVANPGMVQVINSFPTANFTATPAVTCPAPADVSFNNTSTGSGPLTCNWNFGDSGTQTQTGTGTLTHIYENTGNYQACLQVTDVNGCSASICKPVKILSQASPAFTVNNTTVCAGSAVNFVNQTSPTATAYSWDFQGDGIVDSYTPSPVFVYTTPGTYTPTLKASYSPTCFATTTGPAITVVPGLVVNFTANQTFSCDLPFTVTFTNNSFGTGISSNWMVNGQNVGSGSPFTHTFTEYGNYNITLMSANSSGCSSQSTINNMIVVQAPTVNFSHPQYICAGETLAITQATSTSANPVVSWAWDFDGDMIPDATGNYPEWQYNTTGVYQITAFVTTESGCVAAWTSSQTITVLDAAVPNFTANTTMSCAGQSIEFCIPALTSNQYSWNFGDGSGWTTMNPEELCIVHDYQDTGYFSVTVTVFNQACNAEVVMEDYIYITPPVAKFDLAVDCDNLLTVSFGDLSIEADQIIWDFGDDSPVVEGNPNPTHVFPAPGTYTITQTAINDLLGCPDHATMTVNLVPPSAEMSFELTTTCPPALVQISTLAQSTNWLLTMSNGDILSVQWNSNSSRWEVSYTHNGNLIYNEFTAGQNFWPMLIFDQAGCYDIHVYTEDSFGCSAEAFYPNAVCAALGTDFADFTWSPVELCDRVEFAFNPTLDNLSSWEWNFNDAGGSSDESTSFIFPTPYSYGQSLSVSLTATNSGGCISTVTHQIPVDFPVIPEFTPSASAVCANAPVSFTNSTVGNAVSYHWDFGDPSSGANNTSSLTNPTHAFAANGLYTVCLSATNNSGCVRTTCNEAAVLVSSPIASFTNQSLFNSCLFAVTFTNTTQGTINSATWNFGDGQTGSGNLVYHTYPLGVFDVSLTVTNQIGCSSTAVVNDLFNFAGMIGPFTADLDDAPCAPFDIDLTAYNPNDTYFTYFWDFNDGNGDPSGSTVTSHTYLEPGTYCPQLIMTDPHGCSVLIECQDPIVVEQFTLDYTMNQEICAGETIEIQLGNGSQYTWGPGTPVAPGASEGSFILSPQTTSSYTLTGGFSDCVDVQTIEVVVHPAPTVGLSFQNLFCQGDEVIGLSGGIPEGPSGQYRINGVEAVEFDPSQPAGLYELTYVFDDENGCSAMASQTLEIRPLPVTNLATPSLICDNNESFVLTGGSPSGGVYHVNGEPATSFDPELGAGAYDVGYSFTDTYGCSSSVSASWVVYPTPVIDIMVPSVCLNEEVQIQNLSSIPSGQIDVVYWNIGGVAYTGTAPDGISPAAPGQYNYSVTMASANGCIASEAGSFSVWPLPVAAFTYEMACENQPTVFTATGNVTTGLGAYHNWEMNGQFIGDTDHIEYVYDSFQNAEMTLTVTSLNGCSTTITESVNVWPSPVLDVSYGPACEGFEVQFAGTATLAFGGVTGINWNFGDGVPLEVGSTADHLFDGAGTYPVYISAASNLGCQTTLLQWVTVYPNPEVSFVVDKTTTCANEPVGLLDLSSVVAPSDIIQYAWYFDNALVSQSESDEVLAPGPGWYDVRLVVTTNADCTSESTELNALQVYPVPVAGFSIGRDEVFMSDPRVEVINEASQDVVSWTYHFGDGQSASFSSGSHLYSVWRDYEIIQIVRNAFGCSDSTVRNVTVSPDAMIYIPNAFTPDGNGHNEIFQPVMSGFNPTFYTFTIFDRWGRVVFETSDLNGGWNGLFQNTGLMSTDGAYAWRMEYRMENNPVMQKKEGMVILLK